METALNELKEKVQKLAFSYIQKSERFEELLEILEEERLKTKKLEKEIILLKEKESQIESKIQDLILTVQSNFKENEISHKAPDRLDHEDSSSVLENPEEETEHTIIFSENKIEFFEDSFEDE